MTDIDLSGYRVPDNLIPITMTLDALREKAARFINDEFGMNVRPDALLKQPYKFCDFRIMYPELFRDIGERYGVTEERFRRLGRLRSDLWPVLRLPGHGRRTIRSSAAFTGI